MAAEDLTLHRSVELEAGRATYSFQLADGMKTDISRGDREHCLLRCWAWAAIQRHRHPFACTPEQTENGNSWSTCEPPLSTRRCLHPRFPLTRGHAVHSAELADWRILH
jgi:hypothetical protein